MVAFGLIYRHLSVAHSFLALYQHNGNDHSSRDQDSHTASNALDVLKGHNKVPAKNCGISYNITIPTTKLQLRGTYVWVVQPVD